MRVGENLRLHVEVDDDLVLPFTPGTGVHSDHLEFTVSHGISGSFKLGTLLAPGGQFQVRLWEKEKGDKKQPLDEPFSGASGTWLQGEHGDEVDLTLALAAVQDPSSPLSSSLYVFVSDADKADKQETLMRYSDMYVVTMHPMVHENF